MREAKFIDVEGVRTRYFEAGSGEHLLLLHGGNFGDDDNVDCAENWARNWDGFAGSFHVIAIDKLGQGHTDNPRPGNYKVESVVAHALGFIRALGLDRLNLVGHSRGGYLAMRLTMEDQDRISALTVVDSASMSPGSNVRRGPLLAGAPKPLLSRESIEWVTGAFSYSNAHITSDWLDAREAIAGSAKNAEAVEERWKVNDSDYLPGLNAQKDQTMAWIADGKLRVPTLLVWGKNDPSAVVSGGIAAFDIIAESTARAAMHIFSQAGHYSYREQPDDFVGVVKTFIEGG